MNPTRYIALLATSSLVVMAASIASATPFSIHWTAPGDDSLVGQASAYDLRYSNLLITAANFHQATQILGLPSPAVAGTQESFVVPGLSDGVLFYLAIKSADEMGNWSTVSNVLTRNGQTTGIDPLLFSFSSPRPNPARVFVHWAYSVPHAVHVQIDVFDVTGRHVHTVASGERNAGTGDLSWDLRDEGGHPVGAGVYLVKARLGAMEWTKRLIVVR